MKTINKNENSAPTKNGDIIGCTECGHIVKIEKFDEKKNEITFSCSKCAKNNRPKNKVIPLKDFIDKMNYYSYNFIICSICQKRPIEEKDLKYCPNCDAILCLNCIKKHITSSKNNCTEDSLMDYSYKNIKCPKHHKEIANKNTHFCITHQTHYCDSCQRSKKYKHFIGCIREELLNYYIGDNEKQLFKAKVEESKIKKKNIEDKNKKQLNLLKENSEKKILEINKEKEEEINKIKNEQLEEEEKNKNEFEKRNKQIEDQYNEKLKELINKREADKQSSKEEYEKKSSEIMNKNIVKITNKEEIYEKKIDEEKNRYILEEKKLKNDEKVNELDIKIKFEELIERAYDKNKDNYYNLVNYLFVVNDFKSDYNPNLDNEEKNDNINLNRNVTPNGEINNNIQNEKKQINNINGSQEMEIENKKEKNRIYNKYTSTSMGILKTSLINDSKTYSEPYNTFEVIKSINKDLLLIYLNKENSMISYNLAKKTKEEIDKIDDDSINISLRYSYDKIKNRDLIISNIPTKDKSKTIQKVWNANDWKTIKNCQKNNYSFSTCFVQPEVIIDTRDFCQYIKETDSSIFFLDTYYDEKNGNLYIIGGGKKFIKSINWTKKEFYRTYNKKNMENKEGENYYTDLVVFNKDEKQTLLFGIKFKIKYITIWDFHTGNFNYEIIIEKPITSFCLWNKDYLFVGCEDNTIKFYSLEKGEKIDELKGYSSCIIGLKKIKNENKQMLFSQEENGEINQYTFY